MDANEKRPQREKRLQALLVLERPKFLRSHHPITTQETVGIDQLYSKVFLNLAEWANFGALSRS